jgi:acetolactate synthase-1/2/3 large subunit
MEQGAPVKMVLLNNNYLGNVRQWQEMFFHKRYSFTPMVNPDYEKVAAAYGIPCITVTEREKLDEAIQKMVETDGPFLLQVAVIEEGEVLPMCCPGSDVDDMLLEVKK